MTPLDDLETELAKVWQQIESLQVQNSRLTQSLNSLVEKDGTHDAQIEQLLADMIANQEGDRQTLSQVQKQQGELNRLLSKTTSRVDDVIKVLHRSGLAFGWGAIVFVLLGVGWTILRTGTNEERLAYAVGVPTAIGALAPAVLTIKDAFTKRQGQGQEG